MPDQQQDSTTDQQAPEQPDQQGDPAELGEAGKKALAAERARATEAEKQAKALQAQIDALNDSKLTETERLQKQITELVQQNEATQLAAARDRVAVAEQIPPQLVPYLAGNDEAELLASAKAIKAAIAEAVKPGTPKPDPSQGAGGVIPSSTADQFAAFVEQQLTP